VKPAKPSNGASGIPQKKSGKCRAATGTGGSRPPGRNGSRQSEQRRCSRRESGLRRDAAATSPLQRLAPAESRRRS
jgi:hypothetical protein